jgi:pilus assembly protein Flp/PilA
MKSLTISVHAFLREVLVREDGQDMIEYALVVALLAFGSVSGMGFLAAGINNEFSAVATTLTSAV